MGNYTRWILINLLLPLSPFAIRLYIIFIGSNQGLTINNIAEVPEILFYSIFLCVIALNINLNGQKRHFEQFVRLFLTIILVLDFLTLGMVYSNNYGTNTLLFSLIFSIIPLLIAIAYKFFYKNEYRNEY